MNDSDLRTAWNAPEPVNPADLRRYWDFTQKIQAQHPPTAAGAIGIDIRCIEAELPGTNVAAVWVRAASMQILQVHGALKEWEHGTDLDDVVFQVAATFPFGGGSINAESFREQLRAAAGAE